VSREGVSFRGAAPFRVKIVHERHPHVGVTGTCDPTDQKRPGGMHPPMAIVNFDEPHLGVDSAYASADELERAPRR
jgi:hypothetical protein